MIAHLIELQIHIIYFLPHLSFRQIINTTGLIILQEYCNMNKLSYYAFYARWILNSQWISNFMALWIRVKRPHLNQHPWGLCRKIISCALTIFQAWATRLDLQRKSRAKKLLAYHTDGETARSIGSAFHTVPGARSFRAIQPRNILMDRFADYFNHFLITEPLPYGVSRSRCGNYVHEEPSWKQSHSDCSPLGGYVDASADVYPSARPFVYIPISN